MYSEICGETLSNIDFILDTVRWITHHSRAPLSIRCPVLVLVLIIRKLGIPHLLNKITGDGVI